MKTCIARITTTGRLVRPCVSNTKCMYRRQRTLSIEGKQTKRRRSPRESFAGTLLDRHCARGTFSIVVKIVARVPPSDARSTLTVSPDLLALVVESGTLAHVTETVGGPAAARAAILLVHVGRTLACVSGAVFRQVTFVVGRPAQRPRGQKLSNKTSVSTDGQTNAACFDYRRVSPSKEGGTLFSRHKCRTVNLKKNNKFLQ